MSPRVERFALVFGTFLNLLMLLAYLPHVQWTAAPRLVAGPLARAVIAHLSAVIG